MFVETITIEFGANSYSDIMFQHRGAAERVVSGRSRVTNCEVVFG
jgi:hypothetical protein